MKDGMTHHEYKSNQAENYTNRNVRQLVIYQIYLYLNEHGHAQNSDNLQLLIINQITNKISHKTHLFM